jgi:hypothetical protein
MTQIAIQLDDKVADALERASRSRHIAPEGFVVDALKRQLALEWLRNAQQAMAGAAEAAGYESEEDLMNDIS